MKLLIELHDRQPVGLNDSSKLKKLLKRVREGALRLLLRQLRKKEQLRSLEVVRSLVSLI